jgi:hypothetical protein
MPIEDIFYIYRWSPGTQYHHSAVAAQAGGDELVQGLIDANISVGLSGVQKLTPTHYRDHRSLSVKSATD